jgi:uncharacterized membrane protein SpoIIM required for sporulation
MRPCRAIRCREIGADSLLGFIDVLLVPTALVALCAGLAFLWRCLETLVDGPEESGRGARHYAFLTIYCVVVLIVTGPVGFAIGLHLSLTTGSGPYCC